MKVAKIIATCFNPRKVVENTTLVGDPVGFFSHSQNFSTSKEIISLLDYNIKLEKKCNPGTERDIIIVNSNVNSLEGNNFINEISGTKIPGGQIICLTRENIGRSFGSFSDAFAKYKDNYDFFLFTEDDIIIAKDNYLKIGLDLWHANEKCGFVAYISTTKIGKWHWKSLNLNSKTAYSCHGATGLSSTEILREVFKKHGCLPHYKGSEYYQDITHGEVAFPNSILQLGYKLIDLPKDVILSIPAYDLMRNIQYRKFPNFFERINFYIKTNLYKLASQTKLTLKIYICIINFIKKFCKKLRIRRI